MEKEIIAYKLIKEYPGSPSLDSTLTIKSSTLTGDPMTGIIYTYYGNQISKPEKFPEFWQPVYKPIELVKSWEYAFDGKGYFIGQKNGIIQAKGHNLDTYYNKSVFRLESQAKSALAFAQLSHIVAYANGDWVADWVNYNQYKYVIDIDNDKLDVGVNSGLQKFLPMKSQEIAMACLKKHRTLWEDFWMINK